ncbi:HAD family hydrolase [Lutimaribacter sp. EGI FJ00015]|uniref:HAD family hydrolase n=1 Tax=Lutimaribacter degradans TaxID=2945989 RepID=A0ACC5ZRN7_9RHOB|nr:HAD family hydrolase [Lutimaribacter sp. EGI FJ00013]MCM2560757.1 HAD family hydrolase [Lutimaribacter sp. EGI FJ00013]MCO0612297.1 HAD family hydrolase [Lutimaribacter sp. EGI FJ00015]MCO0634582.1 HAD family hydrolase [Lutimaribacter sp. EGI FJ00014]
MDIQGIIFDKDGTLFDFGATWNGWAAGVIDHLSGGDAVRAQAMADAARFDLGAGAFHPDSPVIAGTSREAAECLASALPERDLDEIERLLDEMAARAPLAPAVPLDPFLAELGARGLRLGVMTNDSEVTAMAHLNAAGIARRFDFIAGFDSGHGAKPAPEPLLAFATFVGLAPANVVMVGDSLHDLVAGRAAGMRTVGVLTGMAGHDELAPMADVVLPDIGHLPTWLVE